MSRQAELQSLPVHPVPAAIGEKAAVPEVRITGLVAQPLTVTPADLATLARVDLTADFSCKAGWTVPGLHWEGMRLSDVLALARMDPSARYVRVCSGEYVVPFTLAEAERAMLCDRLNGEPLPVKHGAPWRLLVPDGVCYTSVKWVDCLEVTAEPGDSSGERIALARLENERRSD